jgi:hypothetical protein
VGTNRYFSSSVSLPTFLLVRKFTGGFNDSNIEKYLCAFDDVASVCDWTNAPDGARFGEAGHKGRGSGY